MRRILLAAAWLMLLTTAAVAQPGEEIFPVDDPAEASLEEPADAAGAEATPPDLMDLLGSATEDQRTRMLRFIRNRYPSMGVDIFALLQTRHPGIFTDLDREIQALITTRYPRLAVTVEKLLQQSIAERYPQVRQEIAELIAEKYPDVLQAMYETGEGGDPAQRAARLVKERHRALLEDVRVLLRERHPTLLEEVQREVIVKHPALLADVAGLVARKYPELSREVTATLTSNCPELIPGILAILNPPAAEEQGPPPE